MAAVQALAERGRGARQVFVDVDGFSDTPRERKEEKKKQDLDQNI